MKYFDCGCCISDIGVHLCPTCASGGSSSAPPSCSTPDDKWAALYNAVNEMMAPLGAYGEISAKDDRVAKVMDALQQIDGGVYRRMA